MQDGGSIDCACYEMLNCSPFYPNRLCEHNPTDSIWIWQMPQTTGGQPRHPAWQFLKTASFSSAIVCMAMVAAMNWNRIILLIPEHQLCRLRHQRGEMRVTRTPPSPRVSDSSTQLRPKVKSCFQLICWAPTRHCQEVWNRYSSALSILITTFKINGVLK